MYAKGKSKECNSSQRFAWALFEPNEMRTKFQAGRADRIKTIFLVRHARSGQAGKKIKWASKKLTYKNLNKANKIIILKDEGI